MSPFTDSSKNFVFCPHSVSRFAQISFTQSINSRFSTVFVKKRQILKNLRQIFVKYELRITLSYTCVILARAVKAGKKSRFVPTWVGCFQFESKCTSGVVRSAKSDWLKQTSWLPRPSFVLPEINQSEFAFKNVSGKFKIFTQIFKPLDPYVSKRWRISVMCGFV